MSEARRGRIASAEDGITLIEVLAALFVLAIALFALASVAITSLTSLRETRDRELATNAASSAIEDVRTRDYRAIAMAADVDALDLPDVVQQAMDVTGPECVGAEPVVVDGAVDPPVEMSGERAGIEVHTIVTWEGAACGSAGTDLKRVIVVALFTSGARTETVVQSTLVAPVGRGLPVPDFRLSPTQQTLVWTQAQIDGGLERCAEHRLRNLGADDRYEFELVDDDGERLVVPLQNLTTFLVQSNRWGVTAHLEYPAPGTVRNGVPPSTDDDLLEDSQGNQRPDTGPHTGDAEDAGVVPSGGTALLSVCSEPLDNAATDLDLNVALYSRFDERRVEIVHSELRVQEPGRQLFLQDRVDLEPHPRGVKGSGNQVHYRAYVMGPLNPETNDRIQNLGPTLHNWSVEVGDTAKDIDVAGSPDLPGTRLRRQLLGSGATAEPAALRRLDWRHQFQQPTELLPNGSLTLWVAPVSALTGTVLPDGGLTVSLTVQLDGLNANENVNNPVWDGITTPALSYQHTEPGWQEITIPLSFAGHTFESDQRLRLRVRCDAASSQDCNLAYDAEAFPSRLEVRLQ